MTIRVAHLTGLWQAGAGAAVRIHEALREVGVASRLHSAIPIDGSIPDAHSLIPIDKPRQRWNPFRSRAADWHQRIRQASRQNTDFEAFSPPVALQRFDLTPVLKDVDVLHLHWGGSFIDFKEFFSQVSLPVVWTLHDQHPYLGGFHYQGDVDAATSMLSLEYECRDLKREALAGLKLGVVGNSRWSQRRSTTTGILPANALHQQIYYPLPNQQYQPHPKRVSKQRIGIDPKRFVVGFASAAMGNRRKGFVDLVAAINRLPRAVQANMTLVSFGYQPSKALRKQISIPWIHLGRPQGGREQSPIYSAMDVFVIPSLEEAFGQTALEALACQTAVIGTDVGGIPEMIQAGVTGLLSAPRDPHSLADCIAQFFVDRDLAMACGMEGRRLVLGRHDPSHIARSYESLYRTLLMDYFAAPDKQFDEGFLPQQRCA